MAAAQEASDKAQEELNKGTDAGSGLDPSAGLEPDDNNEENDDGGQVIKPRNTAETQTTLRELFNGIATEIQKRKDANESIGSLREKAVTLGISKKAQAAVEAFMKLNENDQMYFDEAVTIYRAALGKPVQRSLELVNNED